jgi:hypothetical protein
MKERTILIVFLLFIVFAFCGYPQEAETEIPPVPQDQEIKPQPTPPLKLGRIYFPRDFVHANQNYTKGAYSVTLISKDEIPYFQVANRKGDLLFEEMAVIKTYQTKAKGFKYRVRKEMLRGYEYFRIQVTKPGQQIMAYFLLKQTEKPAENEEEPAEEKGDQPGI